MNTIEALPIDQIVCCIKLELWPLLKQLPEMKNEMLRAISELALTIYGLY
jgi:hypothetical protein